MKPRPGPEARPRRSPLPVDRLDVPPR